VGTGDHQALGPVVLIVSVEVPEPLLIDDGLNLQVGGAIVAAEPFSIMLPQVSVSLWLNPPREVIVTVVVAVPPAVTDAGESAAAETVNPGTGTVVLISAKTVDEPFKLPSKTKSCLPSPFISAASTPNRTALE
jgi:hypothetical protein